MQHILNSVCTLSSREGQTLGGTGACKMHVGGQRGVKELLYLLETTIGAVAKNFTTKTNSVVDALSTVLLRFLSGVNNVSQRSSLP